MRKNIILIGLLLLTIMFTGCKPLEKIMYPTKRSYEFDRIADQLVKDMNQKNNKDLVKYFAKDVRSKYGTDEIIQELEKVEDYIGTIKKYNLEEGGKSGHRGGLGETIVNWEFVFYTEKGIYLAHVNWSDGDDRRGTGNKKYRDTQGIERLGAYAKDLVYDKNEKIIDPYLTSRLAAIDFPVQYPNSDRPRRE